MIKKLLIFLFLCIFFFNASISKVSSCGCGLAIGDETVFNALKETQAYLLIDIKDKSTYSEMPFFRMVSMDDPHDVTIVFPIDGIPTNVEGKKMTSRNFLTKYKINRAEEYFVTQDFSEMIKIVSEDIVLRSNSFSIYLNGFPGWIVGAAFQSMLGGVASDFGGEPNSLAHFDFEGGQLDIYDASSKETLDSFIKSIDIKLTGEVSKLVEKYKDYYVAVLKLSVPSALDAESRQQLKSCPEQTEKVKQALQEKSEFSYSEIESLTSGTCQQPLRKLVSSVTNLDDNLEGTLVNMQFTGNSNFFYPTSIVNSYKYPVTDQKYFIKTPTDLDIKLLSSKSEQTASFDSERWHKITSTEEDIKGSIIKTGIITKVGDIKRAINQLFYDKSELIATLILLLLGILPFIYYRYKIEEKLTKGEIILSIILTFTAGLFVAFIVMLVKKKTKFALTLLFVWILFTIIFPALRFILESIVSSSF
jgi:hypothetical protein